MTADIASLDAHEQPSEELRSIWKTFSRTQQDELIREWPIDDVSSPEQLHHFRSAGTIASARLATAFDDFVGDECPNVQVDHDAMIYYHPLLPGLHIVPSVLPPEVQKILVSRLVHRDLSDPTHTTNMHLHFKMPYPTSKKDSFFSYGPESPVRFEPKDPSVHNPLSMSQVMNRKLHWVTLGGQYDWTNRVYPGERPPDFPSDVASLLESLFPKTRAETAIVNFYTPGDTMMMHRDVSEETDNGLVSISLGCDCLFMIAPNNVVKPATEEVVKDGKEYLLLRLRSGDALYMAEDSRFAWHGVPKVLKGTCPEYLADWPAEDGKFEEWRGWMRNKRINLNVRQMRD